MKGFSATLLGMIILSSCGSDAPSQESTSDTSKQEIVTPDETLAQADALFESLVDSFPKHWVEVEVTATGKVYHEYCGGVHPSVKLYEKDSSWKLETNYGKDSEVWNLQNMTGTKRQAGEQQIQDGIFVVTKETFPDEEIYEVSYFWNITAGFCTFGDFFAKGVNFADNRELDSFEIRKQECP